VPVGNPAKFRAENLRAFLAGQLETAPKLMRDAAIRDTVSSWLFRLIQEGKITGVEAQAPVAILSEGQGIRTVIFDAEAAAVQAGKSLTPADYGVAQHLIDTGVETEAAGGGGQYVGEIDGRSWRLNIECRDGRRRLLALDRLE
jgi:hypothetical protein